MSTNILSLDRAIQNTILWLNDVEAELSWENRDSTYKATKAVLQAIRDRLPIEEVVHLCANLPLVMKGMLMDGYDFKEKPVRIRSIEEFDELVQQHYDPLRQETINTEDTTIAVLRVLNQRIGGGEMQKVAAAMPERIKRLFELAGIEVEKEKITGEITPTQ